MTINISIPPNVDALEYFVSFSTILNEDPDMNSSLLGVADSLRQAEFLVGEPLGMLACLTAEEEAAAFLYYSLKSKGYPVPQYGKIQRHADKVKLLVFAQVVQKYFFSRMPDGLESVIEVARDGEGPKISRKFKFGEYIITQEDCLETIVALGEGEDGHDNAINNAVDEVLAEITPKGFTIVSHIRNLANRRNFCLYGNPEEKFRLISAESINHYKHNCISMILLGFLVYKGESTTVSMVKLVNNIFRKLK